MEYFKKSHITVSINIPLDNENFAGQVEDVIGGKDMPVIVYCANKTCVKSHKAAEELLEAGFTNVMCYTKAVHKNGGRKAPSRLRKP